MELRYILPPNSAPILLPPMGRKFVLLEIVPVDVVGLLRSRVVQSFQ
jgi:hypothetical protein